MDTGFRLAFIVVPPSVDGNAAPAYRFAAAVSLSLSSQGRAQAIPGAASL